MALYESIFMVRPDVSSAQVEELTKTYTDLITAQGGKVTKVEQWGLRNLTYRIKKNRKAHYVFMNLDTPSAAVKEMERLMGISEDVLRTLTVRVDALEEGPSAMLQNKGRDERGGRRGDRRGGRDDDRGFGRDRDVELPMGVGVVADDEGDVV